MMNASMETARNTRRRLQGHRGKALFFRRTLFPSIALLLTGLVSASAQSPTLITLHTFTSNASGVNSDGAFPKAELIEASDGDLYGVTSNGGVHGTGTLFKISPAGMFTLLHSFAVLTASANAEGANPDAPLVEGMDGNFYGTAPSGGANTGGTLYKITPAGLFTLLHSFATNVSEGYQPNAPLIQALDGAFYGTTSKRTGGIFKMMADGTTSLIHAFSLDGSTDGKNPYGPLVQGTDGNLYGTTQNGGSQGYGTLFVISPPRTLTSLYSFDSTDGSFPKCALVQGSNGNFYGTAFDGGLQGLGTAFEVTTGGYLTIRHSFQNTDGAYPNSLIEGSDGSFYGTTYGGGASHVGSIFKMDLYGKITTLHSFNTTDGAYPRAGLIEASDGNLYGTTYSGGANNDGTVFCLQLHVPLPAITTISPNTATVGAASLTLQVQGTDFLKNSLVRFGNTALATTFVSATQLTATVPQALLATAGTYNVVVANPPSGESDSNAVPFTVGAAVTIQPSPAIGRSGSTLQVYAVLKNTSSYTIPALKLTGAQLNGVASTQISPAMAYLTAGHTIGIMLTFPGSAAAKGTMATLTLTYTSSNAGSGTLTATTGKAP